METGSEGEVESYGRTRGIGKNKVVYGYAFFEGNTRPVLLLPGNRDPSDETNEDPCNADRIFAEEIKRKGRDYVAINWKFISRGQGDFLWCKIRVRGDDIPIILNCLGAFFFIKSVKW